MARLPRFVIPGQPQHASPRMGEAVSQGRAQAVVRGNSLPNFSAATTGRPFSLPRRTISSFAMRWWKRQGDLAWRFMGMFG
jgi:hypothetical protein